ncbi:MAG TPA: HD domain-containing protein [Geobacteraceae bacterium]|nr:HD domain-containing protein [Geobacteraceae bacterium]
MRTLFVKDIKDRDHVSEVFLVKEKITAMAKNGKPYLTIRLMDKSGEVDAKVWDNADQVAAQFERNDFLAITAKASVYLGKMQLVISELRRMPEEQVVLADFLPETENDIRQMEGELHSLVASLSNDWLRRLLENFLADPGFMARYRTAPAAKGMHHVYLGGLLEHSLAVARLVDAMVPLYAGLDRDLLVAGALLHDVGKVREMTYSRSFDYSDEGKLLGHITIGVEIVHERISAIPGFPPELAMLLKHMLLSHHGQYEYGSPKRPKTVEATILSYLDDLDSKINGIRTHIRREGEMLGNWTSYHRLYDRYYYLDGREGAEAGAEAPSAAIPDPPVVVAAQEPSRETVQRKNFHNNPFEKLKGSIP